MTTRLATLHDLAELVPLFDAYRQFYGYPSDPDLATHFLQQRLHSASSYIVLAPDASGKACGFCQLYPSYCSLEAAPVLTLYDLFVQPAQRRHGLGKVLLGAAEQLARDGGFVRLDLSTARSNTAAQALYTAQGWALDTVYLHFSKWPAQASTPA